MLIGLLRRTGLRWGFAPVWDFGLHYVGPGASFALRPYVITCVSFNSRRGLCCCIQRHPRTTTH
jgi:hypothetical protein